MVCNMPDILIPGVMYETKTFSNSALDSFGKCWLVSQITKFLIHHLTGKDEKKISHHVFIFLVPSPHSAAFFLLFSFHLPLKMLPVSSKLYLLILPTNPPRLTVIWSVNNGSLQPTVMKRKTIGRVNFHFKTFIISNLWWQ